MDTIIMNSENSKTSKPHILKLKLTDKLDLSVVERLLHYQILAYITHGIILKAHTIINFKNQHRNGMKNLHYQMDLVLYQIFRITLNIFLHIRKHGENINKPSIQIYVNKIGNRITFKIKNDTA